jgi:hypothetical protein
VVGSYYCKQILKDDAQLVLSDSVGLGVMVLVQGSSLQVGDAGHLLALFKHALSSYKIVTSVPMALAMFDMQPNYASYKYVSASSCFSSGSPVSRNTSWMGDSVTVRRTSTTY